MNVIIVLNWVKNVYKIVLVHGVDQLFMMHVEHVMIILIMIASKTVLEYGAELQLKMSVVYVMVIIHPVQIVQVPQMVLRPRMSVAHVIQTVQMTVFKIVQEHGAVL